MPLFGRNKDKPTDILWPDEISESLRSKKRLQWTVNHHTNELSFNDFKFLVTDYLVVDWCPICKSKQDPCVRLFLKYEKGKKRLSWHHLSKGTMHQEFGCGKSFRVMTIEERNERRKTKCNDCVHHYYVSTNNRGINLSGYGNRTNLSICAHFKRGPVDIDGGYFDNRCSAYQTTSDMLHPSESQIVNWLKEVDTIQPKESRHQKDRKGKICSRCGSVVGKNHDYCGRCGERVVPTAMHCSYCGARIGSARYCPKCGRENK